MTSGGGGAFTTSTLFGYEPTPDGDTGGRARYPGSSPVVSWNTNGGLTTDAILWILVTSGNGTGPVKLYAYQAVPPLPGQQFSLKWHDATAGPWATKFMVPTVVNGYVYVGGQKPTASCSAGSCLGRVVVWH